MKGHRRGSMLLLLSLILCLPGCFSRFLDSRQKKVNKANIEEVIGWLGQAPSDTLEDYPEALAYVETHKVYVSMTTSPTRIDKITNVLRTLDLTHVDAIIISLPERYGRDLSPYVIPEDLVNFPKVHINRIPEDLGPITKLVPAVAYALHADPKRQADAEGDLVIIIDDDTGYPRGMVTEFIKALASSEKTAFGGSTQPLSYWNLDHTRWPDQGDHLVVEGFGGVGFKLGDVDYKAMGKVGRLQYAEMKDRSCYLSDDMVISYLLARSGIARRKIKNRYFDLKDIVQFPYGFGEDALHRGAGDDGLTSQNLKNANALKYKACLAYLAKRYPPF